MLAEGSAEDDGAGVLVGCGVIAGVVAGVVAADDDGCAD